MFKKLMLSVTIIFVAVLPSKNITCKSLNNNYRKITVATGVVLAGTYLLYNFFLKPRTKKLPEMNSSDYLTDTKNTEDFLHNIIAAKKVRSSSEQVPLPVRKKILECLVRPYTCLHSYYEDSRKKSYHALPNGCFVSGLEDGTIKLLNCVYSLMQVFEGHTDWVQTVCMQGNKNLISGSNDCDIRIWDMYSGDCLQVLTGHQSSVMSLCLINQGILASGSQDGDIKIWDLSSGSCLKTFKNDKWIRHLSYIENGNLISSSHDNVIKIWNINTGNCDELVVDESCISAICCLPNDKIVTGSSTGFIKLWDLKTKICKQVLGRHTHLIDSLQLLNNGNLVSISFDGAVKVWGKLLDIQIPFI